MQCFRSLNRRVFSARTLQHIIRWEHTSLQNLAISDRIKKNLSSIGITSLFPVQQQTIPSLLAGKDVICRSKTGSGKTLAFLLPILERISITGTPSVPRALILAPTRELALQIQSEFLRVDPSVACAAIYGGVSYQPQIFALKSGVDVVVGTPGRVLDLLQGNNLDLSKVDILVLDEADRMLEQGFKDSLETIFSHLPKKKQTLLFSATLPAWISKIQKQYLNNPEHFDLVGDEVGLPSEMESYGIIVENESDRYEALKNILLAKVDSTTRVLLFTERKDEADSLAAINDAGNINIVAIHGDKSQVTREKILSSFKKGIINVLVATDVAARGLDIPNVDYVIHYRFPNHAESFMHRSGRTARAGKSGINIFLGDFSGECQTVLQDLIQNYKLNFKWISMPNSYSNESLIDKLHEKINCVPEKSTLRFLDFARHLIASKGAEGVAALASYISGPSNSQVHGILSGKPEHITFSFRVLKNVPNSQTAWREFTQKIEELIPGFSRLRSVSFYENELFFDCPLDFSTKIDQLFEVIAKDYSDVYELAKVNEVPSKSVSLFQPRFSSISYDKQSQSRLNLRSNSNSNSRFERENRYSDNNSRLGRGNRDSDNSFRFGRENKDSNNSFRFGRENKDSNNSFRFGRENRDSDNSFSFGRGNKDSDNNFSFGRENRDSDNNFRFGRGNKDSDNNFRFGRGNQDLSDDNTPDFSTSRSSKFRGQQSPLSNFESNKKYDSLSNKKQVKNSDRFDYLMDDLGFD